MNKELKVEAGKDFNVSAGQLYKAWTDAEQLKQWWKPMGNTLQDVTNELKEGGAVKYIFADNKLVISGEYIEVKEKEKLSYTWNWELPDDAVRNASYALTVEFKDNGTGSRLNVLQENFEDEESLQPHREGWEKGLNDLQNFLSGNNESMNDSAASNNQSEADGYRENPDQVKVGGG